MKIKLRQFKVRSMIQCTYCSGRGYHAYNIQKGPEHCYVCQGTGFVNRPRKSKRL